MTSPSGKPLFRAWFDRFTNRHRPIPVEMLTALKNLDKFGYSSS